MEIMNIHTLKELFLWCAIINGGLYIFFAIACIFMKDLIYRIHNKIFNLKRETFDVILYSFLGFYKMLFIIFILVPYIALEIVG